MGQAIGEFLPAAIGVAISPIPIIAVVLMLATERGRVNGPAFLVGWIVGIVVAGAAFLLIAGAIGGQDDGEPATWVSWVELLLARTLTTVNAKPIAATMTRTVSAAGMDWGTLAAAGVLTIVPGALVIWFVRNYIAKGFALGRV